MLVIAAKGAGERVLVCHLWASGAERVPRASLVLQVWLLLRQQSAEKEQN